MRTDISGHRLLGVAALVMLLQGCGGPESSSTSGPNGGAVPTNQISMYLTVESSEPGTAVVRANLNDGKVLGTSFRLDGGDFLRACVGSVCRPMADNDSIFTPDYIARFDYLSGIDYVVAFNRQDARNAPDSRVKLPPAFSIVTPVNHQPVTDGDTVQVSWAPTGAAARVQLWYEAECSFVTGPQGFSTGTLSRDDDADGMEAVRIDPIVTFARSNTVSAVTRCSIDVIVRHELDGRVDPAFDDGVALGIVSRKVRLDYVPR
jgi:hypothetical protein